MSRIILEHVNLIKRGGAEGQAPRLPSSSNTRGSYQNRSTGALLTKAQRGHCKATHHVVQINEGIVDGHHLDFAREDGSPGDQAANAAKSGERKTRVRRCNREPARLGMGGSPWQPSLGIISCSLPGRAGGNPAALPKAKAPWLKIKNDPRPRKVNR